MKIEADCDLAYEHNKCSKGDANKGCMCIEAIDADGSTIQTCGYEDNGHIVKCGKTCCNDGLGCDGECPAASGIPAHVQRRNLKISNKPKVDHNQMINIMMYLIISLFIINTYVLLTAVLLA